MLPVLSFRCCGISILAEVLPVFAVEEFVVVALLGGGIGGGRCPMLVGDVAEAAIFMVVSNSRCDWVSVNTKGLIFVRAVVTLVPPNAKPANTRSQKKCDRKFQQLICRPLLLIDCLPLQQGN